MYIYILQFVLSSVCIVYKMNYELVFRLIAGRVNFGKGGRPNGA